MGYSTTFKGELKFTTDLTSRQLGKVKSFLGEDGREHPEWDCRNLTYFDLELLDDFSGLKWDGGEKTYDLVDKVNVIIDQMRKEYPEFGLEGSLLAQGEDMDDRWVLNIVDGRAVEAKIPLASDEIMCPQCSHLFKLGDAKVKGK